MAQKNQRRQFSLSGRTNPFDEVAGALFRRLLLRPGSDWWMVSRVSPTQQVVGRLTGEEHGQLLGRWSALMRGAADLLRGVRDPAVNRETMIVRRGMGSSTWNTIAQAYNTARAGWINALAAAGALELLDVPEVVARPITAGRVGPATIGDGPGERAAGYTKRCPQAPAPDVAVTGARREEPPPGGVHPPGGVTLKIARLSDGADVAVSGFIVEVVRPGLPAVHHPGPVLRAGHDAGPRRGAAAQVECHPRRPPARVGYLSAGPADHPHLMRRPGVTGPRWTPCWSSRE